MSWQAKVNEYAKLSARSKKIKERHEELRTQLIAFLRKHECPTDGPFYLELNDVPRTLFSWEDLALSLLRDKYPKNKVKKVLARLKAKAGTKQIPTITIKVNESWKG